MRKALWILLLPLQLLFAQEPPSISSEDAHTTLSRILEAHASYTKLTPLLVQRTIEAMVEHLDPMRSYFLKEEIEPWLNLPGNELVKIQEELSRGDFRAFEELYSLVARAIHRRRDLEKELCHGELSQDVSPLKVKELPWADSREALLERLALIRSAQMKALSKVVQEPSDRVMKRIHKRRRIVEEKALAKDPTKRHGHLLQSFLKAFASACDSHTSYFTPTEATQFLIQVQQRLFGIGVQLRDDLTGFRVMKIIEGGPASHDECELREGDLIVTIDTTPVVGMGILEAVSLIRGEEGGQVKLGVLRTDESGEEFSVEVVATRGEVVLEEARLTTKVIPFGDGVLAHLALHGFYQDPDHSSTNDLRRAISKIRKEHKLRGILLDLRKNSGGVLPQAVGVTGLFITKGIVVSIKDNRGRVEHLREVDGKTSWDGPLVILTSKASASAAEIVAQTLQDYGRAIVVGDEHTFGKGTFQTFTLDGSGKNPVNPKGEFKVTRGRYYTVSGKSPQYVGVKPDLVIPGPYSKMEIGERYTKYPLETDSIHPNFHDDLSDIPPPQKEQISWLYRFNLQPKLTCFSKHLPRLTENSRIRMGESALYTAFLEELEKESPEVEVYLKGDPQLQEALHVLQDLIWLSD